MATTMEVDTQGYNISQFPGIQPMASSDPDGSTLSVTAGLVYINPVTGQKDYEARVSTDVDTTPNGEVIPKNVTATLTEGDNGSVVSEPSPGRLSRGDSMGSVNIVIGNGGPTEQEHIGGGVVGETVGGINNGNIRPPSCTWQPPRQEPKPDPSFQIFVRNHDGKAYTFSVRASDTVNSLMEQIRTKIGIPPQQQRLVANGRNVCEGHRLSEYGIEPESTVYLTGRLRGG